VAVLRPGSCACAVEVQRIAASARTVMTTPRAKLLSRRQGVRKHRLTGSNVIKARRQTKEACSAFPVGRQMSSPSPRPSPPGEGVAAARFTLCESRSDNPSREFSNESEDDAPSPGGEGRGEGGPFNHVPFAQSSLLPNTISSKTSNVRQELKMAGGGALSTTAARLAPMA